SRNLHSFPTRRSSDLEIAVNGTATLIGRGRHYCDSSVNFLPLAHENGECLLKVFAESQNTSFVSSHHGNLSAFHVSTREEMHYRSEEHTSELQSLAYL